MRVNAAVSDLLSFPRELRIPFDEARQVVRSMIVVVLLRQSDIVIVRIRRVAGRAPLRALLALSSLLRTSFMVVSLRNADAATSVGVSSRFSMLVQFLMSSMFVVAVRVRNRERESG